MRIGQLGWRCPPEEIVHGGHTKEHGFEVCCVVKQPVKPGDEAGVRVDAELYWVEGLSCNEEICTGEAVVSRDCKRG